MNGSAILGVGAVILSALALLPGTLGVLKFTHRITAHPAGAFVANVLAIPLYWASIALLALSAYLATRGADSRPVVLVAAVIVGGISLFGFLMHTRFMFRPVRHPQYISIDDAIKRFGSEEEVVGVLDRRGRPFAYVTRLARRPHIVYQTEGDAPFIMTHCILSHSSMAYELNRRFAAPRVFISSVLANNLVFYDQANHCTVLQILNRSTDNIHFLQTLPTVMTSLDAWKRLYPESNVWVRPKEWRDTFYLKLLARASVINQKSPDLVYPLAHDPDPRLPLKAYVMGVRIGGEAKAYPLDALQQPPVIEDVVGGEPVVFFASERADFVQLFSRKIEPDRIARFRPANGEIFQDVETGSSWTVNGICVAGPLQGRRLIPIPHYNKIFWCVWADFFPSTALYDQRDPARGRARWARSAGRPGHSVGV